MAQPIVRFALYALLIPASIIHIVGDHRMWRELHAAGVTVDHVFNRYGLFWRLGVLKVHSEQGFACRNRYFYLGGWFLGLAILVVLFVVEML
ncbi:MAG TPA: hypothetical protein VFV70_08585 [Hyphomonadaceae bacterium]|nr:hypothetical protein [Hyphomonadaceae bacterium]